MSCCNWPAAKGAARAELCSPTAVLTCCTPATSKRSKAARALGDLLVVGVNSDRSVRALKGAERPVVAEAERAEILAALEAVDFVVIFDSETPRELIARLLPDVLVKGADWGADEIVGRAEVEAAGGRVASIALQPGYSTSDILQAIRRASAAPPARAPR